MTKCDVINNNAHTLPQPHLYMDFFKFSSSIFDINVLLLNIDKENLKNPYIDI
jgi:hypothetical protein